MARIVMPYEVGEASYRDFIDRNSTASFWANLDYLEMVRDLVDAKLKLYCIWDNSRVIAAMPVLVRHGRAGKVMNSLPFYGGNPGVILDDTVLCDEELRQDLISLVVREARDCYSATIVQSIYDNPRFYSRYPWTFVDDSRIALTTRLRPDMLGVYNTKARNQVLSAQRKGVEVYQTHDLDTVAWIQKVHNDTSPGMPKPKEFFEWLKRLLIRKFSHTFIFSAFYRGNRIAALVCFKQNQTAEYFMPVVLPEYRNLSPMNLLIYIAMTAMYNSGARVWNWGGTKLDGTQDGVLHFKKQFGGIGNPYCYYTLLSPFAQQGGIPQWVFDENRYFFIAPTAKLGQDKLTGIHYIKEGTT